MELPKSKQASNTQLGTRNNLERSSMKTVILILALATSVCALTTAHASQWKVYRDDVEGYSVTYPAFLRLIPPVERHPEADQNTSWVVQTKSFQSADGKVELYIESHPAAPDDSLETFFNTKIQNRTTGGDRVQYSLVKDNWYVISGVNTKGFEFYEKFYYFTKNGESWYVYWDFIYPHAQHKIYDALVAPIADGFVPNLRGEHE
jgi:hypothetical protein